MRNVDTVLSWGGYGISAILRQILLIPPCRRVLLGSYVWELATLPTMKSKWSGIITRILSCYSRAVTVMTDEQLVLAKKMLPRRVPVIRFVCGIDTSFYKIKSNYSDVPEIYRSSVDKFLTKPYAIMLGDQQRCNEDALKLLKQSNIKLVRVCRDKKTITWFNENNNKHGFNNRLFVFEDLDHKFLRFLLQHASAYVGLVDSKWQPAGWTTACEALASGLPIVLYEGLVSRELVKLGAEETFLRRVPMNNVQNFKETLEDIISHHPIPCCSHKAQVFTSEKLDLEITGEKFVQQVEMLYGNTI